MKLIFDGEREITIVQGGRLGLTAGGIKLTQLLTNFTLINNEPDLIILGSDVANDNGMDSCMYRWDLLLYQFETHLFKPLKRLVPIIIAPGPHDYGYKNLNQKNKFEP